MRAAMRGKTEMVKVLLSAGAEVNQQDKVFYYYTPISFFYY